MPVSTRRQPAVTLSDVANLAGVSRYVAGHVLNNGEGNTRVSEDTAQKVRRAATMLNYRPNFAALSLRGRRSHTFGLLVASAGDPLRSFLVQYLDAAAARGGSHILIGNTIGNDAVGPDRFDHYVAEFARRNVDGILCAVHRWCPGDRAALMEAHPNVVFYEDPGIPGAAFVSVDRAEAVRVAVNHLIAGGRQRIGLALMSLSRPTHLARREGYEQALAAARRTVDPRLIFDGEKFGLAFARYDIEAAKWCFPTQIMDHVIDALVRDGGADAIVAHDDFWAAAIVRRLQARGIGTPQNVAVVGYLNHYLADWTTPTLTTLDLEHEQSARTMVSMLEEMVTAGPLPPDQREVKIAPRLIVRASA